METSGDSLHVGVAGWSYRDWRETVYRVPVCARQPLLFGADSGVSAQFAPDPLVFLARYVDMIEVNSSFYRVPSAATVRGWAHRVASAPDFFFTAKLNARITHDGCADESVARQFRAGFAPLREVDRLRGILAQFRYDFVDRGDGRRLLDWIARRFGSLAPLVVEVRHRSWDTPGGLAFLRGLGFTVADLDYPLGRDSFNPVRSAGGDRAYLRLHGRNREAWFKPDATVEETYNYDYSDTEIAALAGRSRTILADIKELTIVANNHYRGKAVSAALRLKAALSGRRLPVPPALLETYPNLHRIATGG